MDAAKLTERERAILALLLHGHSVKSAANEIGITEYAAQELLRAARRKTGVTSSREAARLVANQAGAQIICDSRTVLETKRARGQSPAIFAMGGIMVLGLIAGIGLWMAGGAEAPPAATQTDAPKVVSATPASGATIPAGRFTLSVTYDRPMRRGSMSFATGPDPAYPECHGKPAQSADGRTFSIACTARAGQSYIVWFNHGRYMNFRDAKTGAPATPHRMAFSARP